MIYSVVWSRWIYSFDFPQQERSCKCWRLVWNIIPSVFRSTNLSSSVCRLSFMVNVKAFYLLLYSIAPRTLSVPGF